MIDYKFQGRLQYIPGGALSVQMSAWPSAGVGTSPGTTNLLAWWSLDETSGTRQDSHTGNYDMSVQGTPSYTTGKKGNAGTVAVVNGAGSYFYYSDSGNALDCPAGSSITVACWVKLNNLPSNNAYPVSRWGSTGDWTLNINSNGALLAQAARSDGTETAQTANSSIASGTWCFCVLKFDHTVGTHGTVYASVNNGTPVSAALTTAKIATAGVFLSIGDLGHTTVGYGNMSGAVDEVCVYGRALSDDELAWLYNEGAGRAYSEL